MTQAIFLSYASQDANTARRICDALRAAGLEVWFDQSELRGGDAWDASIRKQIKECALFVPLISANTNAREEGYFRREWNMAVNRMLDMADDKLFLLPVVIDATHEQRTRVPDKFRERQWSRLNDDAAMAAFANRVAKLIAGSAVSGKNTPNAAPVPTNAPPTSATPSSHDTPSIAVLAFANRSASADDEYFSDGLADELLNVLAKIRGLRVAARTSSFQFKGKNEDIGEIGRRLNVAHVLEGSVRKSGDRVRISVQLVNAADGFHLWSETYDRTLDDIFAVQDDIARSVANELRTALMGAQPNNGAIANVPATPLPPAVGATLGRTLNSEAHRLRLQGRSLFQRGAHPDRAASISHFERAVAIDPLYAGAWADLSFALYWRSSSGGSAGAQTGHHDYMADFPAAKLAAERAVALEPNLPEALHARAAIIRILDWNQAEALELIRKAAALAPNDAHILLGAATVIGDSGHLTEALALARRAIELDPIGLQNYSKAANIEAELDNDAAAETLYRIACGMSSRDAFFPRFGLFLTLLGQQRFPECAAMLPDWSMPMHRTLPAAMLCWAEGDRVQSDANLNEIKAVAAVLACYQIAQVHAYRGEADATFEWLGKCHEVRDPGVFNAKTNRLFAFVHGDPRWKPMMQQLGFDA